MKRTTRQAVWAYAMIAPALLLFSVFVLMPLILAVVIAFKRVDLASGIIESPWVGFQNFTDLFTNVLLAERIRTAFRNTILFTICFVPVNLLLSLTIATFIHSLGEKRQAFYRAAFYLPGVTSAIVFAMIWKWIYDPNFGLLNYFTGLFGFPPINWTGDPHWAMWAVILAALGAGPGGNVLIYLAALGAVPVETHESARVEGANFLQRWWFVTLPYLRPVTLYLLILNTIGSFQVFELVFVLTSGGPAGSSTVIVYEIYDQAFVQGRYGPAGALSLVLIAVISILAFVQFRLLGGNLEEVAKPGILSRTAEFIGEMVGSVFGRIGNALEDVAARVRRPFVRTEGEPSPARAAVIRVISELPLHLILFPLAVIFFIPMIWMFLSAFTPRAYLQSSPPEVALNHLSFANYEVLLRGAPYLGRWAWNSFYLALLITVVQSLISCLGGYVFARLLFPGKRIIFSMLIVSIMLPYQALIIPLFLVISSGIRGVFHVDLLDTHWAIILPSLCSPVGIFLMRQYIENMPREIEEAARIDGCEEWGVWRQVILPLCKPALGAWGILSFTGAWKSFFWPFVVLGSEQLFTLEVGLQTLQQQNAADYGLIMSGATVSAVPMIIVFFIFQKQIVRGLTLSAVKG